MNRTLLQIKLNIVDGKRRDLRITTLFTQATIAIKSENASTKQSSIHSPGPRVYKTNTDYLSTVQGEGEGRSIS